MKRRISKVFLCCFIALTMIFNAAAPASAAVNFNGYYEQSNGKILLSIKSLTKGEAKVKYTFQNMKTKQKKTNTQTKYSQEFNLYRNVWYKTTVDGYNSAGKKVSSKTTYLAHEPAVTIKLSGSNRLKVTWPKVYGSTSYQVYASYDQGKTFKKVKTTTGNSYTTGSLYKNKNYYFYVKAIRKVGSKTYYSAKPYQYKGARIYTVYK